MRLGFFIFELTPLKVFGKKILVNKIFLQLEGQINLPKVCFYPKSPPGKSRLLTGLTIFFNTVL